MSGNKKCWKLILEILLFCITIFVTKKAGIIFMPDEEKMVDFQFDMITVSTVFAGFSYSIGNVARNVF